MRVQLEGWLRWFAKSFAVCSIPASGRSPGGEHGNSTIHSWKSNGQRRLGGYSPYRCKEQYTAGVTQNIYCVKGLAQYPAFAPSILFCFWLFRSGIVFFLFLSSCTFWLVICPNFTNTQLLLVPHSFFVICSSRRCLFKFKHCSKGSQVSIFTGCSYNFLLIFSLLVV